MNALRASDNEILDAYLWGNSAINASSENNYRLLLQLVEDIARPNAYAVGGKSDADGLIDLGLDVLTRDARLRANRIALSHFYRHSPVDMIATSLMDIQLYHDFGIAVALGCEDNTGYTGALNESGQLLAEQLAEFNQRLERWLADLQAKGMRVTPNAAPQYQS
ncbi:MAG: hypothetical protein ACR2RB_05055 [Gammaproteobacteria bacterium]